jgi:hypothetical protein
MGDVDNIYKNGELGYIIVSESGNGTRSLRAYGEVTLDTYKESLRQQSVELGIADGIEIVLDTLESFNQITKRFLSDGAILNGSGDILAEGDKVHDVLSLSSDPLVIHELFNKSPFFGGHSISRLELGSNYNIPVYREISDEDKRSTFAYWELDEYRHPHNDCDTPAAWEFRYFKGGNLYSFTRSHKYSEQPIGKMKVRKRSFIKDWQKVRCYTLFPYGTFESLTSTRTQTQTPLFVLPGALNSIDKKKVTPKSSTASRLCLVGSNNEPIENQNLEMFVSNLARLLKRMLKDNDIRTDLVMGPQYVRTLILDLISTKDSQ